MRERLIDLLAAALDPADVTSSAEIADYLLDNGVIVPPVKVGQTVWSIVEGYNYVFKGKIYEYVQRECGSYFRFTRNRYFTGSADKEAIGKTVFLTPEEAEAALKAKEDKT